MRAGILQGTGYAGTPFFAHIPAQSGVAGVPSVNGADVRLSKSSSPTTALYPSRLFHVNIVFSRFILQRRHGPVNIDP